MKDSLDAIPSWLLNLITVGSGMIALWQLIVALWGNISSYITEETTSRFSLNLEESTFYTLAVFIIMLVLQVRKYRKLSVDRMKVTSESFSKTAFEARNRYFEVLIKHKNGNLSLEGLKGEYEKNS